MQSQPHKLVKQSQQSCQEYLVGCRIVFFELPREEARHSVLLHARKLLSITALNYPLPSRSQSLIEPHMRRVAQIEQLIIRLTLLLSQEIVHL